MSHAETYNFEAIRRLLQVAFFQQEDALRIFCKRHFDYSLPDVLPFFWKVELLLMHCQDTDTCEQLLQHLKAKDEQQYRTHIQAIRQTSQTTNVQMPEERLRCQISLKKPRDLSEWSEEIQTAAIRAIAAVIGYPPEAVSMFDIVEEAEGTEGPVKVTIEMPEYAFERLLTLGAAEDPALAGLGITHARERVSNPHNIENIRRMLNKMFTLGEFREFCQRHFSIICDQFDANANKTEMIETLLDYVCQNSRIPHILVFAQKHNPKTYGRYEPYHVLPRMYPIPRQQTAKRRASQRLLGQPLLNLSFGEGLKALTAGTGVAAALMFLLQRVLLIPVEDQNVAEVLRLVWGTTALFAIAVARAALWGANRNRGKLLAAISVASYWVGMMLGNTLAFLSNIGEGFTTDLVLSSVVYGIAMTISPLFSFSASVIVLIIGTYWAYHHAR